MARAYRVHIPHMNEKLESERTFSDYRKAKEMADKLRFLGIDAHVYCGEKHVYPLKIESNQGGTSEKGEIEK